MARKIIENMLISSQSALMKNADRLVNKGEMSNL